ncbi:hypothetical protein [Nostoc sp.]|uniref:hypothetical protein n=1 Tax=Nostoc sp. TaxID=1180 RepID=UPI002FFB805C
MSINLSIFNIRVSLTFWSMSWLSLVACTYQDNKPFCDIRFKDLAILPVAVLGLH